MPEFSPQLDVHSRPFSFVSDFFFLSVQALEVFHKAKKQYTIDAKDLNAAVAGFSSHKYAANNFKKDIAKCKVQIEELEEKLLEGRKALKENEEEQQRIQEILNRVYSLDEKIVTKKSEKTMEQSVQKKQRSMLQQDLTRDHFITELREMLQTFDTQFEGHRDQKKVLETKMNAILQEIERLREEEASYQSLLGRLHAAKENHEKQLRRRYEKMVQIGQEFSLGDLVSQISQQSQGTVGASQDTSFFSTANNSTILGSPHGSVRQSQQQPVLDISPEDMNEYFRALERKKEELQEQQSQHRAKKKEQEDDLNNEISDLKGKCKALESNKDRIHEQVTKIQKEMKEIQKTVSKGTFKRIS